MKRSTVRFLVLYPVVLLVAIGCPSGGSSVGYRPPVDDIQLVDGVHDAVLTDLRFDAGGDIGSLDGTLVDYDHIETTVLDDADALDNVDGHGDGDGGQDTVGVPDVEPPTCGDDKCDGTESCDNCPQDCGDCCGNQVCEDLETCDTCPDDCGGSCCGQDGCQVEFGEDQCTCPIDCGDPCNGKECGDDGCAGSCGTCSTVDECQEGICIYPPCGDGLCDAYENCLNCAGDCGSCPTECEPGCDWAVEECTQTITGHWVCAAKMVEVPEGNFWMGCNETVEYECYSNEYPYHEVYLDAYYIDRTEVTAEAYAACVSAGGCSSPGSGNCSTYQVGGMEDHPVNYVNWSQAEAFCLWAGKRLPTEAEWEKAARGTDGRRYPWGNESPTCDLAVAYGCPGETQPVCSVSPGGDTPYGLCDMAGNAQEWVADWYFVGYYEHSPASNPQGPTSGSARVRRGGSFDDCYGCVRASLRGIGYPSYSYAYLGFRCGRSE